MAILGICVVIAILGFVFVVYIYTDRYMTKRNAELAESHRKDLEAQGAQLAAASQARVPRTKELDHSLYETVSTLFEYIDTDHSGTVSIREFATALEMPESASLFYAVSA